MHQHQICAIRQQQGDPLCFPPRSYKTPTEKAIWYYLDIVYAQRGHSSSAAGIDASPHGENNEGLVVWFDSHLSVSITVCIRTHWYIDMYVCVCVSVSYWMSSYYRSVLRVFSKHFKSRVEKMNERSEFGISWSSKNFRFIKPNSFKAHLLLIRLKLESNWCVVWERFNKKMWMFLDQNMSRWSVGSVGVVCTAPGVHCLTELWEKKWEVAGACLFGDDV